MNEKETVDSFAWLKERVGFEYRALVREARDNEAKKAQLESVISRILALNGYAFKNEERDLIARELSNEIAGYGPIDSLIKDPEVSEIMVNGCASVFVERRGKIQPTSVRFTSEGRLLELIRRIVEPLGRRVDHSTPFVDARLPDGSRVHAVIPPVSLSGPVLTIRKFCRDSMTCDQLLELGTYSQKLQEVLETVVESRLNVIISGASSTGKTTLLGVMCSFIKDEAERVIVIEDSAELHINRKHLVRMEARHANLEGKGEVSIRDIVKNALRMRPDRLIVGEVRGAEAFDLVHALNTGHQGSMSTVHANSTEDSLLRLENMAIMAGENLSYSAIRYLVRSVIDVVIHMIRLESGARVINEVSLVRKGDYAGCTRVTPIARYELATGSFLIRDEQDMRRNDECNEN